MLIYTQLGVLCGDVVEVVTLPGETTYLVQSSGRFGAVTLLKFCTYGDVYIVGSIHVADI